MKNENPVREILPERENEGTRNDICQKSDRGSIDTKREIARAAGVSHDTIAKAEKIIAQAPAETIQAVRNGDISINKAYTDLKKAERKGQEHSDSGVGRSSCKNLFP